MKLHCINTVSIFRSIRKFNGAICTWYRYTHSVLAKCLLGVHRIQALYSTVVRTATVYGSIAPSCRQRRGVWEQVTNFFSDGNFYASFYTRVIIIHLYIFTLTARLPTTGNWVLVNATTIHCRGV
jgi:hypothetical protein